MANHPKPDWHPADIMAALRKCKTNKGGGWTLRGLSLARGYSENAVVSTLRSPWPAVEAIVARELGVRPQQIWPSRYHQDGTPKRLTAHPLTARHARHVRNGSRS